MKRLLITGGTVFVSKFTATYFVKKGYEIYVLNRNTKTQVDGVNLICADRNNLGDILKAYNFDAVIDVCAYNKNDYEYALDTTRQSNLISDTKDLKQGLKESLDWYLEHKSDVIKKDYMGFIDKNFAKK